MSNLVIQEGIFQLPIEITTSGSIEKTLKTKNTYVDKDINILIEVPQGDINSIFISDSSQIPITVDTTVVASDMTIDLGGILSSQPESGKYITLSSDIEQTTIDFLGNISTQITDGFLTSDDNILAPVSEEIQLQTTAPKKYILIYEGEFS